MSSTEVESSSSARGRRSGVDIGLDRHSGPELPDQGLARIEADLHRDSLNDLREVSSGIVGRQQAEFQAGCRRKVIHVTVQVHAGESIHAQAHVLALGATQCDREHVYADPAGHPFCLIKRPQWAPSIPEG